MDKHRIAIFDDWLPFHIGNKIKKIEIDEPIDWSEFIISPQFETVYEDDENTYFTLNDHRAINEIHRLLEFETCPICRKKMDLRPRDFYETILVCLKCGFWGGRGSRMDNVYENIPLRGVLGIYKPLQPLKDLQTEYLVSHLRKHPDQLPNISPKRAEKFVVDLLKDYLNCEVLPIGGTKDKGVDGYVLKGDKISSMIQIKWREKIHGAESVKVVREVAGTLLARGIPSGILVSNRNHFSKDAIEEANQISKLNIATLGKMRLTLIDYHNILDMLEISNTILTRDMKLEDWISNNASYEVFEGAMKLPNSFVNMFR